MDVLLLPDPAGGCLALTYEELLRARERAAAVSGCAQPAPGREANGGPPEGLLDSAGLAAATSVPASWWESAAREGRVPHRKIGRWVRFRLSEVVSHPAFMARARRSPT